MEIVVNQGASGPIAAFKERVTPNFGSLPTPFSKEVTVALTAGPGGENVDAGDCVDATWAGAPPAGVVLGGCRVVSAGVIGITIGTTGGATITPNTLTFDVLVSKGSTAT